MNNENKILVKNGLIFTIAPFLPKMVSVFLLPIMTNYLTDVDFGIAGTISAYSQAIGAFVSLGLGVVLLNSFFKSPETYKDTWKEIYGILNIWMIIYAIIQATILYFCVPDEAQANKWWIIVLTNFSTVFFGPTAIIGNAYFIYTKQSIPIVWRSFFASVITIIVNFVLIVYFRTGYMGWYVGSFAGIFFSNATYWYVLNVKLGLKPSYHINLSNLKKYLNLSLPTIPHYYSGYLLDGAGRMILDQNNVSQGEIGKVSISHQLGAIFQTGVDGFNNAISPYIMQSIKLSDGKRIKNLTYLFVFLIMGVGFLLALWSKEILDILLSNESLKSSYLFFIFIIMALCSRPLYLIASSFYFYYEKTKQLLLVSFGSGIVAVVLYLLLTPFWGIWAFVAGFYIANLYFGYSGFFYKAYKDVAIVKLPIALFLIIQLLMTAIAYFLVDQLLIKIVITICLLTIIVVSIPYSIKYLKRK